MTAAYFPAKMAITIHIFIYISIYLYIYICPSRLDAAGAIEAEAVRGETAKRTKKNQEERREGKKNVPFLRGK